MKWSGKIGKFAGIEVREHATFLVLLAWIVSTALIHNHDPREEGGADHFALVVFETIVRHAFGNTLMAVHLQNAGCEISFPIPLFGSLFMSLA